MKEMLSKISISSERCFDDDGNLIYKDFGEVIVVSEKVYIKDSVTINEPTYSLTADDDVFISGVTFKYDDNNDPNGNCHKTWTPAEIAIASLEKFNSHKWEHPNSGFSNITVDMCDFNLTWTVPKSGILRINHAPTLLAPSDISVYVNGRLKNKFRLNFNSVESKLIDAYAIQVVEGDVVHIPDIYSRVMLLPFSYIEE